MTTETMTNDLTPTAAAMKAALVKHLHASTERWNNGNSEITMRRLSDAKDEFLAATKDSMEWLLALFADFEAAMNSLSLEEIQLAERHDLEAFVYRTFFKSREEALQRVITERKSAVRKTAFREILAACPNVKVGAVIPSKILDTIVDGSVPTTTNSRIRKITLGYRGNCLDIEVEGLRKDGTVASRKNGRYGYTIADMVADCTIYAPERVKTLNDAILTGDAERIALGKVSVEKEQQTLARLLKQKQALDARLQKLTMNKIEKEG